MRRRAMALAAIASAALIVRAADFASVGYSTGAAEYLRMPLHAQASSLSGSVAAWREGLAGVQFNPAILDGVKAKSVGLAGTYTLMTLDRRLVGGDVVSTLGDYLVGAVSFENYGVANIEGRDSLGAPTGSFGYQENALCLSAAGRVMDYFSVGARVRYLYDKLEIEHANGVGIDAGATFQATENLCFGLSVLNLASYLWWSTARREQVQPQIRAGANLSLLKQALLLEVDVAKDRVEPLDASFGAQYTILSVLPIRAGIATSVDNRTWTLRLPDYTVGAGLRYQSLGFDYGLFIPSSEAGPQHRITILATFSSPW